jgi:hypothetical protein
MCIQFPVAPILSDEKSKVYFTYSIHIYEHKGRGELTRVPPTLTVEPDFAASAFGRCVYGGTEGSSRAQALWTAARGPRSGRSAPHCEVGSILRIFKPLLALATMVA